MIRAVIVAEKTEYWRLFFEDVGVYVLDEGGGIGGKLVLRVFGHYFGSNSEKN